MRTRNAELGLIILALIISGGAIALTDLARGTEVSSDLWVFFGAFGGLVVATHFAIRKLAPNADPLLYAISVLLSGFGYAEIRRLDHRLAGAQLGWIAIGTAAFILTLVLVRDHRTLERYRYSMMLIGIGLMLLPLTPIGTDLGRSARLWIHIGPLAFQPAEASKVVLALFLAGYLGEKREVMTMTSARVGPFNFPAPRHFGPLLLAWILSLAVMFYENDLGSSLLFFALFVVVLYAATARASFAGVGLALFVGGVAFAYHTVYHVQTRVAAWVNPWGPSTITGFQGAGRQIAQSWFALGSGGLTGLGMGRGHPDLIDPGLRSGTLPTDFIFAAIGEELGFLGTVALLLLFGIIAARGFHIALRSRDQFGSLLATGLTVIMGLQALLIMGGVTRLFPLTGITLPFVSYGGSSLLANFVLLALLMRVSDDEAVA